MFLLDTMVVSERGKRLPNTNVINWLDGIDSNRLFVSVISFGEIASGVERKRATEPVFSERLNLWSAETRRTFADRTLPITTAVALRWGWLIVSLKRKDLDLFIAATALEHDLTVVTRNVRHFEATGAKIFNPYET